MVFFTCNGCGTSLKKNQVERHGSCGRVVSCMDCMKEFRGNEYVSHTKCISEAEKYNGPDWKAPASSNKGERKQQAWLETVNAVLEKGKATMSPSQRSFLQAISKHDNVPRKKPKFLNFVRNVTKNHFDNSTVDAVWNRLEEEWKIQAEQNKAATQANGTSKNGDGATNGKTEDHPHENGSNGVGEEMNNNDGEETAQNGKKKKAKKSKRKLEVEAEETVVKKKNKRKREEAAEEDSETLVTKKKKKNKGNAENEEISNVEEELKTGNLEESATNGDTGSEFRWGEIIEEILTARDDKSITLKKLRKKVFSEYYARVGDTKGTKSKEDLAALLNKKLKKKKFKVIGETVRLNEVE